MELKRGKKYMLQKFYSHHIFSNLCSDQNTYVYDVSLESASRFLVGLVIFQAVFPTWEM